MTTLNEVHAIFANDVNIMPAIKTYFDQLQSEMSA